VATSGNVIDQDVILSDIGDICREIRVRKTAVDRWGAIGFMTRLTDRGLPVVQFGQGLRDMTGPAERSNARSSRAGSTRRRQAPALEFR